MARGSSQQATLAYAAFDLWMNQQLEQLVNRWIGWAAPIDRESLLVDDPWEGWSLDGRVNPDRADHPERESES